VRILRVARLRRAMPTAASALPGHDALMQRMVAAGKRPRSCRARLGENRPCARGRLPQVYFQVLRTAHALAVVFPELDRLWEYRSRHAGIRDRHRRARVAGAAQRRAWYSAARAFRRAHARLGKARRRRAMAGARRSRCPQRTARRGARGRAWHSERLSRFSRCWSRATMRSATERRSFDPATLLEFLRASDAVRRPERFSSTCLPARRHAWAPDSGPRLPAGVAAAHGTRGSADHHAFGCERSGADGAAIGALLRARRLAALVELRAAHR